MHGHPHAWRSRDLALSGLLLLLPLCVNAAERLDVIRTTHTDHGVELSWSDTEERLQGVLLPASPRAGSELAVNLDVGSFEGPEFQGPVRVGLRGPDGGPAEVHLVQRANRTFHTTFALRQAGLHTLDVAFHTTHEKVLHANLEVAEGPLPLSVVWALLVLGAGGAAAYGLWARAQARRAPKEPSP